jgi:putative transposase
MQLDSQMGLSLRLPLFDYTSAGGYFVTITVHERKALLGSLDKSRGGVTLTDAGRMVERWWLELPQKFQPVTLDAHAVMPDHFHGIVLLQCSDDRSSDPVPSLSTVMQWFKTMTTAEYFRGVRSRSWPRVNGGLWQRGFHDHIVRSEPDLAAIRAYVEGNSGALFDRSGGGHTGPPPHP